MSNWWPPEPSTVPPVIWRIISADADGDGIHNGPKSIASTHQAGFCGLLILVGLAEIYLTLTGKTAKTPSVEIPYALGFIATGGILWYFDIVKIAIYYTIYAILAVLTLPIAWMDDPPILNTDE